MSSISFFISNNTVITFSPINISTIFEKLTSNKDEIHQKWTSANVQSSSNDTDEPITKVTFQQSGTTDSWRNINDTE